jgi:hypothetical protein
MKIQDTPRINKLGQTVAYQSSFGLCLREYVIPRNTFSPARQRMRAIFGNVSRMWSGMLTDEQQDRWNYAASQVMSHPTLSQRGALSGQQFHQAINSLRGLLNLPLALDPPAAVTLGPRVVGRLAIENDGQGVRLWLAVSGELTEDVMVFGQEPCSAGRHKRRNVAYLGLLPPPINGRSEITYLYKARYGEPRPGTKVFIVTCQTKDGWKGIDQVTFARVPEPPKDLQANPELSDSHTRKMHKGGSRDPERLNQPSRTLPVEGTEAETGGGKAAGAALDEGGPSG